MNFTHAIFLISALGLFLPIPNSTAQSTSRSPRPTPAEITVLPFVGKMDLGKLNPKAPGMFNELSVTKSSRIHIYGTKLHDSARIDDLPVFHLGKLALISPSNRSGKLTAKLGWKDDVRCYYVVLDLQNKLEIAEIKLADGKPYDWSVKSEGGATILRVISGNVELANIKAPTGQVKGVGFAATVRFTKNQADLEVTFD